MHVSGMLQVIIVGCGYIGASAGDAHLRVSTILQIITVGCGCIGASAARRAVARLYNHTIFPAAS
jgi:hypothetical protein